MKFNEKLIKLRKEKGLSQEELGYELNVTRQTVSKWELGQTTPEMDKLVDISKLFNISLDNLINTEKVSQRNETIITNKTKVGKTEIVIIITIIIIAVLLLLNVLVFTRIIAYKAAKGLQEETIQTQQKMLNIIF